MDLSGERRFLRLPVVVGVDGFVHRAGPVW